MAKPVVQKPALNIGGTLLFAVMLSMIYVPAQAVPDSRLWLPGSYLIHMSKLKRAATLVETEAHNCKKILRGGLQEDMSSRERPIFRIVCRNEDRRSFSLLINGVDMGVVDPKDPSRSLSFQQLREQRAREAELARLAREQERKQHFWTVCLERLEKRTTNMRELAWLTRERPEPEVLPVKAVADENDEPLSTIRYQVDFDAKDMKGQPLRYRGVCTFTTEEDSTVKIRPRRSD